MVLRGPYFGVFLFLFSFFFFLSSFKFVEKDVELFYGGDEILANKIKQQSDVHIESSTFCVQ